MPQLGQAIRSRTDYNGIFFLSQMSDNPNFALDHDMLAARRAARAIDALRRGWPVHIGGPGGGIVVAAIETAAFGGDNMAGAPGLLISAARAATLKISNQLAAADTGLPVMIQAPADLTAALSVAIADPSLDLRYPMKGPFAALDLPDRNAAHAALELARLAGLLPAFFVFTSSDALSDAAPDALHADDVAAYTNSDALKIAARAKLPVAVNADAEIVAFRSDADATDHIALIIGNRDASPP
jgi:GTP cyclohydrolase II